MGEKKKYFRDLLSFHNQDKLWDYISHYLKPWSSVLLEKLTVPQLVKQLPACYKTCRFTTMFTCASHSTLTLATLMQSTHSQPISLQLIQILFSRLCLGLPSGLSPSGFHMNTTCKQIITYAYINVIYFYTTSCSSPWTWTPTGQLCTPDNHIFVTQKLLFQILQHICTIIQQNLTLTTCIYTLSVISPHLNIHLTMSFRPTWYVYKLTWCLLREYLHTNRNSYVCLLIYIQNISCVQILNLEFST